MLEDVLDVGLPAAGADQVGRLELLETPVEAFGFPGDPGDDVVEELPPDDGGVAEHAAPRLFEPVDARGDHPADGRGDAGLGG